MAGDWIKMRSNLRSHPKVVRIASALKADRLRVVGGLHAVWCLFDEHSEDGCLCGYTPSALDDEIGFPGFSDLLIAAGWLEWDGNDVLALPDFDTHNGASAKRRAQEAERKRAERAAAKDEPDPGGNPSADDADEKRTRGEERRGEKNSPPNGGERTRGSRLPNPFELPADWRDFCVTTRPDLDPDTVAAKFSDYWHSKPGKGGTKLDWLATWRNWVREERVVRTSPAARGAAAQSFAAADREAGIQRWEEMTGRTHPDRQQPADVVIDMPNQQLAIGGRS